MAGSTAARQAAGVLAAQDAVPVRRLHPSGYKVSVFASLLMALAVGLFFLGEPGWHPPEAQQSGAQVAVTWILLTYIWIQLGSLILVGTGTRGQMWIDALTSMVPTFLVGYVLLLHYSGYIALSPFQVSSAWLVAYTVLLDLVIDVGISALLSRQVVEVGGGGVL